MGMKAEKKKKKKGQKAKKKKHEGKRQKGRDRGKKEKKSCSHVSHKCAPINTRNTHEETDVFETSVRQKFPRNRKYFSSKGKLIFNLCKVRATQTSSTMLVFSKNYIDRCS